MHSYIVPLKALFEKHADPARAAPMRKYMRDQFEFLGIKTPERRELQKQFFEKHGLPLVVELKPILR
ncbi:MAG: DNA alkylation repair protein, partial [Anaerolineales bacterium]|nr:DNA alkylation repair protein [Anaerolineales bacterium]